MRFLIYLLMFGLILYMLSTWGRNQQMGQLPSKEGQPGKSRRWFRNKKNPREPWMQVYETASMEEARMIQARLQEEEVECIVYEQGKKDIHGNPMVGIGLAVPKTSAPHAQRVISRMPT